MLIKCLFFLCLVSFSANAHREIFQPTKKLSFDTFANHFPKPTSILKNTVEFLIFAFITNYFILPLFFGVIVFPIIYAIDPNFLAIIIMGAPLQINNFIFFGFIFIVDLVLYGLYKLIPCVPRATTKTGKRRAGYRLQANTRSIA